MQFFFNNLGDLDTAASILNAPSFTSYGWLPQKTAGTTIVFVATYHIGH